MRSFLGPTQKKMLNLMRERQNDKVQPSISEIGRAIGVSRQFAATRFNKMLERGEIVRVGKRWKVKA